MLAADVQEEWEANVLLRKPVREDAIDMTPMVDVTFLLLIFFMVTAAFSLQKSIEMPRQQTEAAAKLEIRQPPEELRVVEVEIDKSGGFLVMAPDWQQETPGKQSLITALKAAIQEDTSGMRLVVKVHALARLHALVDAIDAGTSAGYIQLEITQFEGSD